MAGTKDEFLQLLTYHSLPHAVALTPSSHSDHTGWGNVEVAACAAVVAVSVREDRRVQLPATRPVPAVSHLVPGH